MAGIVLERAESESELREWLDLRNRMLPWWPIELGDLLHARRRGVPRLQLSARDGAELVGGAIVSISQRARESGYAGANIWVTETHRRQGVGRRLLAGVSEQAETWKRRGLQVRLSEEEAEGRAFAERRGYAEVARSLEVVLDVRAASVEVSPPDGVELTTLAERPDLLEGVYRAELEAVPDIPDPRPLQAGTFEEWRRRELEAPGVRPEGWFLAVADGGVVGYAMLSFPSSRPGVAQHEMTGVVRAWRGRGVAGALKRAQIRWANEAGLHTLETMNDAGNEPIRRLNARLGYRPKAAVLTLRGPLAAR